jgi:hypothetical protein
MTGARDRPHGRRHLRQLCWGDPGALHGRGAEWQHHHDGRGERDQHLPCIGPGSLRTSALRIMSWSRVPAAETATAASGVRAAWWSSVDGAGHPRRSSTGGRGANGWPRMSSAGTAASGWCWLRVGSGEARARDLGEDIETTPLFLDA